MIGHIPKIDKSCSNCKKFNSSPFCSRDDWRPRKSWEFDPGPPPRDGTNAISSDWPHGLADAAGLKFTTHRLIVGATEEIMNRSRVAAAGVVRDYYANAILAGRCDSDEIVLAAARAILAERERCANCQPCTAEDPNESDYQRGRFDGIIEFARAIRGGSNE